MKRIVFNIIIAAAVLGLVPASPFCAFAAEAYRVDPVHTYVMFRIKHLGVGYSFGRFNEPVGNFTIDDAKPENSRVEMWVETRKIDTHSDKRDKHLKGEDFFNADKYGNITFTSTAFRKTGEDLYEVKGDLTLLGMTRSVTVEVRQVGEGKDPWGNYRRGFETNFTIRRSDWGMDFMLSGLGDEVNLTVSVEGIRK